MISEAVVKVPFSQPLPRPQLAEAERAAPSPQFDCFIGVSAHLTELKEFIRGQAAGHQPALLIGERGLRQEQIARALHLASEHREQPFFAVNTKALDEDTLCQLLFGPRGMLENMRRGAIYVNELTGLPAVVQQRFAAHIEEQRWRARSGRRPAQRLIFATEYDRASRNAENRIAHGLIEQLRAVVGDYERSLFETALRQTGGNQTKAGRLLGLRVQTLNMKLKRFAELNKPIIISSEED